MTRVVSLIASSTEIVCALGFEGALAKGLGFSPSIVSLAPNALADGNRFFNRPGPRLVESLETLAEFLHPEAFRFGHEGRGWERY